MRFRQRLFVSSIVLLAAMVFFSVQCAWAKDYAIKEVISMSVGEKQQRNFSINDVFSITELRPMENFIILATGSADEPAGSLTIELETDPELDHEAVMDYSLIGIAFSLDAGLSFINESASTPFSISTGIAFDSTFGFAAFGVLITGYTEYVEFPVPFTLGLELEAAESE